MKYQEYLQMFGAGHDRNVVLSHDGEGQRPDLVRQINETILPEFFARMESTINDTYGSGGQKDLDAQHGTKAANQMLDALYDAADEQLEEMAEEVSAALRQHYAFLIRNRLWEDFDKYFDVPATQRWNSSKDDAA